ncbi:MAG: two-component regulator propeller domain-containing protein, partial [Bacteroidales bacterium]
IGKLLVDKRGWLWMTGNRETSLLIFNPSGTPLNTSDDQLVRLNTNLTEEEGSFETIYALAEDKEGNIWIGTNKGIKIYFSPSQLLNNPSILPYAPRVIMDSITELLLNYEIIKCIKVDQGNRKWIGTDNAGVFLLSENGETELLHFTTDNSPLLSNSINDIEIDGNSGEVFIATEKGLISFRYTATDAKEDYEEIKIFPNPVREGFAGYISISGLKDNSEVKITDAMGGLVYRTKSNGGTAVWDGFRFDGRKASTGVYFVFVSDINGKEKKAGKILFIK